MYILKIIFEPGMESIWPVQLLLEPSEAQTCSRNIYLGCYVLSTISITVIFLGQLNSNRILVTIMFHEEYSGLQPR